MIKHPTPWRPVTGAARWFIRYRLLLLFVGIASMLPAIPASRQLQMDRRIRSMFDANDRTLLDYQLLQREFGGNAVVMVVYQDRDLDSVDGFQRNREISQAIAEIDGVQQDGILSPAVVSDAVEKVSPGRLMLGSAGPPALIREDDPVARGFDALFAGYTHSADHSRVAVVAMLETDHTPATILALQAIASGLPEKYEGHISRVSLVGEPVLIHDGFALLQRDGARLATLTVALLSVVVLVALVDLRFVLLTGAIMVWSITLTRATMVWMDVNLSLVSTILTAIVTVITVASVLHLGVRYRTSRARRHSRQLATERTIAALAIPIFWTCATDAAGFAALSWSRIVPVQQFGVMIAVAATYVFVGCLLFAPVLLMFPGTNLGSGLHRHQRQLARWLRRRCFRLAQVFVRHRGAGVVITLLLSSVAALGLWGVETETSFLKNFRSRSEIVRAYDDVEQNFGGAGVWDVILDAPDQLNGDYLEQVRRLEDKLRTIEVAGHRLKKVLSLADADAIAAGSPILSLATPAMRLSGMQLTMPVFFDALLTKQPSDRKLRIMLRSEEHLEADQKAALIQRVEQTVNEHTSSDEWIVASGASPADSTQTKTVTGYYVMMSRLVGHLVGDQWRCFLASGLLVWGLLMVATRSVRLGTAALLPNLLPVFVVLACVGLCGGKINMGAAMIAAVSIGLSIDGSVHFLASYQRLRFRGHAAQRAAIHSAGNIGVPVLLATIALVVGFSILATSDFVPTATFGLLVAATLAAGTMINLTLLPSFVAWIGE